MDDPDPRPRGPGEPALGDLFGEPGATSRFRRLAGRVVEALLQASPETATELGDHRFDARLDDLSVAGIADRADVLRDALLALDGVDDVTLAAGDRVDLDVLRTAVAADVWLLDELRPHEHDPRVHLPGRALRPLLDAPSGDAAALAARLAGVPQRLRVARAQLHGMSRVHVEAALAQARAELGLLGPGPAAEALEEYARWLEARLPESDADPRLGAQRYAATLWYGLDAETPPDVLLTRAESDLQAAEEELADAAAAFAGPRWRPGDVRAVLDELGRRGEADGAVGAAAWAAAVRDAARRVRDRDLVTVPGRVAAPPPPAASAGSAGPAGTPLLLLAAHEAVPGRALQAAHARRLRAGTRVRHVVVSPALVEGWASYAEDLLLAASADRPDAPALRVHRAHRQLLETLEAVLDVRVHAEGLPRRHALTLLAARGHLDERRADAAWRRVLLAPARVCAPYVGRQAIRALAGGERAGHDALLAHGPAAPRHLRTLLGLS